MKLAKNQGYTVIELLAVVSILVITSGIIVGILFSTLRGSNKAKISAEVTQNGTYALQIFTNAVRNSRSVVEIGGQDIPDDIQDCVAPTPPSPSGDSITLKKIDGTTTSFSCEDRDIDGTQRNVLVQDGEPIINTASVQVESGSCNFSCDQSAGDLYAYPIIRVKFNIMDKNQSVVESQSSSLFETSVSMNNYLP